jgi:hypothetical protein
MAGRVLVRFWKAAQDANSEEQGLAYRAHVEYIMYVELSPRLEACSITHLRVHSSALAKLGERVPMAC